MTARWGLVCTPTAELRRQPAHAAELVSQRLLGEVVRIDRARGGWLEVRGWDDYPGWVRDWSVRRVAEGAARDWEQAAQLLAWGSGAIARCRRGGPQPLPWGARLRPLQRLRSDWEVLLPDGRRARLPHAGSRLGIRERSRPQRLAVELGRAVVGSGYLWGGTTPWGFDCSGLIQWAYGLAGIKLPRDARDQRAALAPVTGRARPGDLIFFGRRGRIGHVAMVTRSPWIIHAFGRVEEIRLQADEPRELVPFYAGLRRPG